jgi:hypothetical protein
MGTRPTRASRTWWLHFLPLLAIALEVAFLAFGAIVVPETHPPFSPLSEFLYYGAQFLFAVGIIGGIMSLGLYIGRARAAKTPQ